MGKELSPVVDTIIGDSKSLSNLVNNCLKRIETRIENSIKELDSEQSLQFYQDLSSLLDKKINDSISITSSK